MGSNWRGIGSYLRFFVSGRMKGISVDFPYSTLTINIVGCFLMAILVGLFSKILASEEIKTFFAVGLLGGFTTFSAFSLETINLFERGETLLAVVYIFASVTFSLLGFIAGNFLIRMV